MNSKNLFLFLLLFISTAICAQNREKRVPGGPPPEFLQIDKNYHFTGKKRGLKITLKLKRKTVMSVSYFMKIEYPDKRILTEKGIVYMRENYDLGAEERLKESDEVMISCQPFTPKRQTKGNYLEICIGGNENKNGKETGKIFVSFIFLKSGYPDIDLDNTPELVEQ